MHISRDRSRFIRQRRGAEGDVVTVWVLSVDLQKKRIALTMKQPATENDTDAAGKGEHERRKNDHREQTIKTGITFGSALAMVISYTTWHSVGWAIFHGLLSWVYVVYFVLRY